MGLNSSFSAGRAVFDHILGFAEDFLRTGICLDITKTTAGWVRAMSDLLLRDYPSGTPISGVVNSSEDGRGKGRLPSLLERWVPRDSIEGDLRRNLW